MFDGIMCVPQLTCRGERTTFRTGFSPSMLSTEGSPCSFCGYSRLAYPHASGQFFVSLLATGVAEPQMYATTSHFSCVDSRGQTQVVKLVW